MQNAGDLIGSLVVICLGLAFFAIAVGSIAWMWVDANRRGKTGCLWALIAFIAWPFGVIAYLILRDQRVQL